MEGLYPIKETHMVLVFLILPDVFQAKKREETESEFNCSPTPRTGKSKRMVTVR